MMSTQVPRFIKPALKLDPSFSIDFGKIKQLRLELYMKVHELTQYQNQSDAVREAVYNLREAMISVSCAQIDLDEALRISSIPREQTPSLPRSVGGLLDGITSGPADQLPRGISDE
mgnify:CR=1 FL=1|jgi:hypothetical protein|tara:strand:- start:2014 stop:2361 length:348 start_codon:yes stop_codon:yes gene_type:complete